MMSAKKQPQGKSVPDHVPLIREISPQEDKVEFTPESVQEDKSLIEKLPKPTGDLRLLNDDEILAVVNNPEDVE